MPTDALPTPLVDQEAFTEEHAGSFGRIKGEPQAVVLVLPAHFLALCCTAGANLVQQVAVASTLDPTLKVWKKIVQCSNSVISTQITISPYSSKLLLPTITALLPRVAVLAVDVTDGGAVGEAQAKLLLLVVGEVLTERAGPAEVQALLRVVGRPVVDVQRIHALTGLKARLSHW